MLMKAEFCYMGNFHVYVPYMGVYLQLLPSVLNTPLIWFKSPRSAEAATDYTVKKLVTKLCIQLALIWRKKV